MLASHLKLTEQWALSTQNMSAKPYKHDFTVSQHRVALNADEADTRTQESGCLLEPVLTRSTTARKGAHSTALTQACR